MIGKSGDVQEDGYLGARQMLVCVIGLGLLAHACATAARVIPIPAPAENAIGSVDWRRSDNYSEVLAAISAVMVRELNFPPIHGVVTFYRNAQAFEAGLAAAFEENARREEERGGKRQPEAVRQENIAFAAHQRAVTAVAVASSSNVLVHEIPFNRYSWSERVRVLAHELTHVVQRDLAGPRAAGWDNWLVEGFADWVAYKVLDSLKIESFAENRQRILDSVVAGGARQTLPSLAQLYSQADISTWTQTLGRPAAYGQGMIAVDLLVERQGLPAVIEYFRLFRKRNDRQANFTAAFGQPLSEFDEQFSQHLASLIAKQGPS